MSVLGLPDGGISSGQMDRTGAEEKVWLGGWGTALGCMVAEASGVSGLGRGCGGRSAEG